MVLRGARRTLATMGSRLQLFVEMHPSAWTGFGYSADDLVNECAAAGRALERLDGGRTGLWIVEGVCLRLQHAHVTA